MDEEGEESDVDVECSFRAPENDPLWKDHEVMEPGWWCI